MLKPHKTILPSCMQMLIALFSVTCHSKHFRQLQFGAKVCLDYSGLSNSGLRLILGQFQYLGTISISVNMK